MKFPCDDARLYRNQEKGEALLGPAEDNEFTVHAVDQHGKPVHAVDHGKSTCDEEGGHIKAQIYSELKKAQMLVGEAALGPLVQTFKPDDLLKQLLEDFSTYSNDNDETDLQVDWAKVLHTLSVNDVYCLYPHILRLILRVYYA